jgi:hypothetical protein
METYVSPETGIRWGYDTGGYVWCDACGGRESWTCSACGGKCVDTTIDRGSYIELVESPNGWCETCENSGIEHCNTCEG